MTLRKLITAPLLAWYRWRVKVEWTKHRAAYVDAYAAPDKCLFMRRWHAAEWHLSKHHAACAARDELS